jgi:hypothetical protein
MKKTWISEDKSQKYIGEFDGENKRGQGTMIINIFLKDEDK